MNKPETKLVDVVSDNKQPHYEPYGWQHWPEYPLMSYQFRRGLGETQEGGGAISEMMRAASRMVPGDKESWHVELRSVADRNHRRGDEAERQGHLRTAMNCWLRASEYYRQAEFWLEPTDPRRMDTFDQCEKVTQSFLRYLNPPGEVVQIPYEGGIALAGYFVRSPCAIEKQPVLICCGGLDSFKDEMWFMVAHGALQRGLSVLMFDGPGQGATLRRHNIPTRYDYEVPFGCCIDYLETRSDVDLSRIAVCGSSMGGYYSARAACFEPRIAACVSHGANGNLQQSWLERGEDHELAMHIKWVVGANTVAEVIEKLQPFNLLDGTLGKMKCPYLIVHGGHDVLGVTRATTVYEEAKARGVDVTLRFVTEEETGADHCQHDNPTIGQELVNDWLADRLGIDQQKLSSRALTSFD